MPDRSDLGALLTLGEVSATLRVSEKTARRMIARGELPFRAGGQLRVSRDSLISLLARGEVRP